MSVATARSAARRYAALSRRWRPADDGAKSPERDLAALVQHAIAGAFAQHNVRLRDAARCEQIYQALDALASDAYMRQYPVKHMRTGMLGLDKDEMRVFASEAAMRQIGFHVDTKSSRPAGYFARMKRYLMRSDKAAEDERRRADFNEVSLATADLYVYRDERSDSAKNSDNSS